MTIPMEFPRRSPPFGREKASKKLVAGFGGLKFYPPCMGVLCKTLPIICMHVSEVNHDAEIMKE
jgi:hypothetical protein